MYSKWAIVAGVGLVLCLLLGGLTLTWLSIGSLWPQLTFTQHVAAMWLLSCVVSSGVNFTRRG